MPTPASQSASESKAPHIRLLVQLEPERFLGKALIFGMDSQIFSCLVSEAQPAFGTFMDTLHSNTCDIHKATTSLLNEISGHRKAAFDLEQEDRLKFIDVRGVRLSEHPVGSTNGSQVIGTSQRVVTSWTRTHCLGAIAFHHLATGVFVHGEEHDEDSMMEFTRALLQARPDLAATVVASVTPRSCYFIYADPAAAYATGHMEWGRDTLRYFVGFVHRAYKPWIDPTISLELPPVKKPKKKNVRYITPTIHDRAPVWLVRDDKGHEYRVTDVLAAGDPLSRGNWVGAAMQCRTPGDNSSVFFECPRTVVKDFWATKEKEESAEDVILSYIHAEEQMAGVCELLSAFIVSDEKGVVQTCTMNTEVLPKRKHRMVQDGNSMDIYRCTSILDFLMVMYDTLEVLKDLHERRGVLYRDVSLGNIRRRAQLNTARGKIRSRFIRDVLFHRYPDHGLGGGPSCVVIDFDHAHSQQHMDLQNLKNTVGTPPYVAGALVLPLDAVQDINFTPPASSPLSGGAKECFIKAHGLQEYQCKTSMPKFSPAEACISRPIHDAVSCFWLMVYFMTTAQPKDPSTGICDDTMRGNEVCRAMEATGFYKHDVRSALFEREDTWSGCLHPDLEEFGPLMCNLAAHARLPNSAWVHVEDEYYLHRAMQRLLLQEVCRILDEGTDVVLDTIYRRNVGSLGPFRTVVSPTRGTKRRGETLVRSGGGRPWLVSAEA